MRFILLALLFGVIAWSSAPEEEPTSFTFSGILSVEGGRPVLTTCEADGQKYKLRDIAGKNDVADYARSGRVGSGDVYGYLNHDNSGSTLMALDMIVDAPADSSGTCAAFNERRGPSQSIGDSINELPTTDIFIGTLSVEAGKVVLTRCSTGQPKYVLGDAWGGTAVADYLKNPRDATVEVVGAVKETDGILSLDVRDFLLFTPEKSCHLADALENMFGPSTPKQN